jgi:hypothetical protein
MDTHRKDTALSDRHPAGKEQWIQQHADQMLQHWLRWGTPLGIAPSYITKLRQDLARCYDQPLLRTFIERSY